MVVSEGWWWLSFADGTKPHGQQFLGVCIVYGPDFEGAHAATWFYDLNPGGELLGSLIPVGKTIGLNYLYRCLNYEESLEVIAQMGATVGTIAVPSDALQPGGKRETDG